jgi:WXG100 family type VII secretion target
VAGNVISFDSDQLSQIAQYFNQEADMVDAYANYLLGKYDPLRNGDWQGEGAEKFFDTMENTIFPKMKQLADYFRQSAQASGGASKIVEDAFAKVMAKARR